MSKIIKEPQTETLELPKDLGIKIGSQEEVFWQGIEDKTTALILQFQREIIIQQGIQALAEKKIIIEQKAFKKKS